MSDGMLDDMEFERQLAEMSDRQLMEFNARQSFQMNKTCRNHGDRITAIEGELQRRGSGLKAAGGIGGFLGGTIAGVVYGLIVLIKGSGQ